MAPLRRSSVLGYLAEVEPLMEPTGGYPIVVRRPVTTTPAQPIVVTTPPRPPSTVDSVTGPEAGKPRTRRRLWPLVVLLVLVIVVLAALLFAVQRRQSTGAVQLPLPSGVAAPAVTTPAPAHAAVVTDPSSSAQPGTVEAPSDAASVPAGTDISAGASVEPSASTTPDAPAVAAAPLTARYETAGTTGLLGLTGYRGRITIANPGPLSVGGWQVTIVLPGGQSVVSASDAEYRQERDTVTFTPTADTLTVPAAASVTFTFQVNALLGGAPTGCAIDERPCG